MKEKFKVFKDIRFRHTTLGTLITIFAIIATILINMGMSALGNTHNLNWDLTTNKAFRLTDTSKEFIENLDKDVEVIVLNTEQNFVDNGEYFAQANQVLKQYSQVSNKIKLSYVDMAANPTYISEYTGEDLQTNSIIVKSGSNHTTLSAMDIFDVQTSYQGTQIVSSQAEQAVSSAIMNVTSDKKVKISLITGFDEEDSSSLISLLEKNNYEVKDQSILTEDIDKDSQIAIIYGPKRDYDKEAISKLRAYLENDGNYSRNLFYVATPNLTSAPNLNEFLKEYNMQIGDGLIYETNTKNLLSLNSPFYAVYEYADSEYAGVVKNTSIPVSIPYSHPIEILDELKVTTLIESSSTSGVVPSNADENWSPADSTKKGPIPAMAIAETQVDGIENQSKVLVCGSVVAFDDTFLSRGALNNSSYTLGVFNKITHQENVIQIESKSLEGQELGISAYQAATIGIILTFVLPIIVVIAGIVVWAKRSNK